MFKPDGHLAMCTTKVEEEEIDFMWKLENFISLMDQQEINSAPFIGGSKTNHEWQLRITPKALVNQVEYIGVYLALKKYGGQNSDRSREPGPEETPGVRAKFYLSVVNRYGKVKIQASSKKVVFKAGVNKLGFPTFYKSSEVRKLTSRRNALTISCRVWLEGELKCTSRECEGPKWWHRLLPLPLFSLKSKKDNDKISPIEYNQMDGLKLLSKHFGCLLDDDSTTDLTLVTKGGNVLKAHKNILAARSSVFEAMFRTDMVEAHRNSVTIDDFDEQTVKGMLSYVYTGEIPSNQVDDINLMVIADKYQLSQLKSHFESKLSENLSIENAAQSLVLAHKHSAPLLQVHVVAFIKRFRHEVWKTESFSRYSKECPSAFVELCLL